MESSDKFPLPTINLLGPNCNGNNEAVENVTVLEQTRVRRLFTEGQLYAFTASYFTTWLGVGSSMYYAFLNGGPVAYLFNYIIVLVGVSAQAASLAELASIQPVAGAQYHWTWVSRMIIQRCPELTAVQAILSSQFEADAHLATRMDHLVRIHCWSYQCPQQQCRHS